MILVPQFPSNWPALLTPEPFDKQTRYDTLNACKRWAENAEEMCNYYENLFKTHYDGNRAKDLDRKIHQWIRNYVPVVQQVFYSFTNHYLPLYLG